VSGRTARHGPQALILNQVALSFGILPFGSPFVLIPLIVLTGRRAIMGELATEPNTKALRPHHLLRRRNRHSFAKSDAQ
jgi:Mn2+/Fe2+ NRAMP family transporter